MITLGELLKQKREEKGIKQNELASLIGYVPQFVGNWEIGKSVPPPNAVSKLADILEINKKELLKAIHHELQVNCYKKFRKKYFHLTQNK